MPVISKAQAGYFATHKKQLEQQGVDVGEWLRGVNVKELPKHARSATRREPPRTRARKGNRK